MATTTYPQPLKVLLTAHPNMDTLDLTGPLEILSSATFTSSTNSTKVFYPTITASHPLITTTQNLTFSPHIPISEAYERLGEFDVLVVPGGGSGDVLEGGGEPLGIIGEFAGLPKREGKERYVLSVCTGSLFLGAAGVLNGLVATTHVDFVGRLEEVCNGNGKGWKGGKGAKKGDGTKVVRERFVVNKFDEGSGLRVITSGGVSCGLDSCLWLVGEVAGKESKERVARGVQYAWREGLVL